MAAPTEQDWEVEAIKKDLFKLVMQGKWNDVVTTYQKKPKAHRAKITTTGDTALHIVVLDRKESVVEKLVKLINDEVGKVEAKKEKEVKGVNTSWREEEGEREEEFKHPLEIANERGNTPLHLAAHQLEMFESACALLGSIGNWSVFAMKNERHLSSWPLSMAKKGHSFVSMTYVILKDT